jgi:hypothetical protein
LTRTDVTTVVDEGGAEEMVIESNWDQVVEYVFASASMKPAYLQARNQAKLYISFFFHPLRKSVLLSNFDAMELKGELLRGIYAYGFERPSAIQQRAIIPVIKGHDVIAQAQSGTGKTATFSISILQSIDVNIKACQALVLAPTRELAQQIQKVCAPSPTLSALIHSLDLNRDLFWNLIRSWSPSETTLTSSATLPSVEHRSETEWPSFKRVSMSSSVPPVVFLI